MLFLFKVDTTTTTENTVAAQTYLGVSKKATKAKNRTVIIFKHYAPRGWQENVVDAAELDVDLEAEVGERLWRCTSDVLCLDALGDEPEHDVSHPLHLGCDTPGDITAASAALVLKHHLKGRL